MTEKTYDPSAARQIELVIRQLDCLSLLPSVCERFLSGLFEQQLTPSVLVELIESDPAFTAKIFNLIHEEGLSTGAEAVFVRGAVERISLRRIREAVLSVKVYQDFDNEGTKSLFRKQLTIHSIAVGCCAKEIAETLDSGVNPQLAYSAGLLHDIGKFALDDAMPKSFAKMIEQARSQNCDTLDIEQAQLGTDHAILGKKLAQKWHFPNEITLAIWLHHSNTNVISDNIAGAKIARIVQLADIAVRMWDIGQSGSYGQAQSASAAAQGLSIGTEQLEQIRENLSEAVETRSRAIGLDMPKPQAAYCDILHTTTGQLAREQSELSQNNRNLQITSSHFDFITEFL